MQTEKSEKGAYSTPVLTIHGTLAEITAQVQNKIYGPTDGFAFQGIDITNAS